MKNLSGRFCVIFALFAIGGLPSSVSAAKYSVERTAAQRFSAQRPAAKKPLPPEATALPQEDLSAVSPVTFDELRMFARDWLRYAAWLKKDGNQYKAVAYLGVSPSSDYPAEVVKWMDAHGWAADRFFLLERKFRATLSVLEQDLKQANLLNHMETQIRQLEQNKQMTPEQKKSMKEQYLNTIRNIQSAVNTKAPVTPDEYELIKLNRDALTRILSE